MVVIIVLTAVIGLLTGYAAYQWQELRQSDKTIAFLLRMNEEQEIEHAAENTAVRLVLDLAMRQNRHLSGTVRSHETSLLLVLKELEAVS